jgi:hypothetical protein
VADKTDFGISTFADAALLRICGTIFAAMQFMSPERAFDGNQPTTTRFADWTNAKAGFQTATSA